MIIPSMPMYEFKMFYLARTRNVELSAVNGAGSGLLHIMVDRRYWGAMRHDGKEWIWLGSNQYRQFFQLVKREAEKHLMLGEDGNLCLIRKDNVVPLPPRPTAKMLADVARERGHWLFDPKSKRWYTPEEFLILCEGITSKHQVFTRIKIKSPLEGVNAAFRQINNLQTRLIDFTQKIVENSKH